MNKWWVVLVVVAFCAVVDAVALAAPPQQHALSTPKDVAAKSSYDAPPLSSFVVMQCDEVVVAWVVLQNNSVYRTDAEHHPDDPAEYKAFLEWLRTGQIDVYEIPCNPKKD
jgi:hypothetical protein